MASSRRSRPSSVSTRLAATVASSLDGVVDRGDRIAVGLSGGVDSIVLLDVLGRLASSAGFYLSAIHVNHRLSRNAGRWAAFCRRVCRARKIPLHTVEVSVERGNSLEAAARAARYAAFGAAAVDYVALAHNQDDQAETLLLQLFRGAGVKGLAAMPAVKGEGASRQAQGGKNGSNLRPRAAGPSLVRPLLEVPRSEILAYARARRLRWVEDESNEDVYFARNFLRHEVLPQLARRYPAYRETLGRSARHLAEAAGLLDELAALDAEAAIRKNALDVGALARLSEARARNLLRWFLARHGLPMPGAERLGEALRQAVAARSDSQVRVDLGPVELRRFAGGLHVVAKSAVPVHFTRPWAGEARIELPELGGMLQMARRKGDGLSAARLAEAAVTVRVRRGGERLRLARGGRSRSLKNLMQEARVPPWQRDRLPLLFCGGDLVWVPGIGVAAEFRAGRNEPSVLASWIPAAAGDDGTARTRSKRRVLTGARSALY